ncbi:MAG TPA: metal ABC transporter permease [Thermoanaerobaculia bacterium]
MDMLSFLFLPFVAGFVLTGIHAYLGIHVVERGVIFVDLSLAQIAALGATVALLAGYDVHSGSSYVWSLGFTIIGAAIFAFTRVHRQTRVPQEAIIGIVYAVSAAASILVMSKASQETEHLKEMLVGNLLAVSWAVVIKTAVLYAVVGLFHFIFRRKFLAITLNTHNGVADQIPNVKLWDFLFYISFGFVVTWSVAIAGVLLVFSYLIVPSVAAMLFAESIGRRLAIGWTMAVLVTAIGMLLSFQLDFPTGATIVCTFGLALLLMAAVWAVTRRRNIAAGFTPPV